MLYICTVIQHISHTASQPKSTPIYIGARCSRKYLIYNMNTLKPAITTTARAGIRRMEADQPPALRMRTCGGKGAGQWPLAMGCAKRKHPICKYPPQAVEIKVKHGVRTKTDERLAQNTRNNNGQSTNRTHQHHAVQR